MTTTPREIDCPSCGKTNEYSLGSCRKCGQERETFDKIEQAEQAMSEIELGEGDAANSEIWRLGLF